MQVDQRERTIVQKYNVYIAKDGKLTMYLNMIIGKVRWEDIGNIRLVIDVKEKDI